MEKELEKVKIISDVLKESCNNEELRWYLMDLINKAKKEVFDDLEDVLYKEIMIGKANKSYKELKKRHLPTLQKSKGT